MFLLFKLTCNIVCGVSTLWMHQEPGAAREELG